jgi:hypothetical protein
MRNALIIIVLSGLLAFAGFESYKTWTELGPVDMGFDGKLALFLMIVLGLLVGVGLMGLVFYSSRKGFDR